MRIEFDENYFMAKAIDEAKIALSVGAVSYTHLTLPTKRIV